MNGLNHEKAPPPALKDRIVRSLEDRGLLRRAPRPWRIAGMAAAAFLLFVAGVLVGHRGPARSGGAGPRWVLLLYEGPGFQQAKVHADRVAEYRAWATRLRAERALELGEELAPDERLLGNAPTRDPGGSLVAGLFIITAPNWAQAVAIAESCPHLRHGGGIAVRRIAGT